MIKSSLITDLTAISANMNAEVLINICGAVFVLGRH